MKVLKRMGIGLVCVPVLLVVAFAVYEIFGAVVNHAATAAQASQLKKALREEMGAEVIDIYTETGNTGGTGNHVDMLSVVLFRADAGPEEIYDALAARYDLGGWGCWLADAASIKAEHEKDPCAFSYFDGLACPDDLKNCYIFYLNESAPFADNIEGH